MKTILTSLLVLLLGVLPPANIYAANRVYDVSDFGLKANGKKDASPVLQKILEKIKSDYQEGDNIILRFPTGRYHFFEKNAASRQYYISNHDQTNPKKVGIAIENMKNLTLDGQGSDFIFHGRMIPVSLLYSENCILKDFNIDFENPHIAQIPNSREFCREWYYF